MNHPTRLFFCQTHGPTTEPSCCTDHVTAEYVCPGQVRGLIADLQEALEAPGISDSLRRRAQAQIAAASPMDRSR